MARSVAAAESLPCVRRKASSGFVASLVTSVNDRSPPRMTWPCLASPDARLAATEPTPAMAMLPSAMQVTNT